MGLQGLTVAHRGCVQVLTGDCRVYREFLQGLTGGTGDDRENTGDDREKQGIFILTGFFRASSVCGNSTEKK